MNEQLTVENDSGDPLLDCAVEIAQAVETLEGRSELISLVAIKYAESGHLDAAVDLTDTINDSYLRDQALAGVAAKCVGVGAGDYAEKLAEMIEDETAYALATEQMAVAYAESGAFEMSIEVAHRLDDSAPTLSQIALVAVTGGHSEQALAVARSIDYPDLKAPVLGELAAKALRDEHRTEALDLILEATETAEEIEFSQQRTDTLVAIASLSKECGEEDQALETLTRAHDLRRESEDLTSRDADLVQIAGGFAELQHYDQADQVIEEIESPFQFVHATAKVALEYHRAGDKARALTLLAQALKTAKGEDVYGEQSVMMRESVLDRLAGCYAMAGHVEEAVQITGLMNSQEQQNHTLKQIAKVCVRSGDSGRVFEVTEMIKDNFARVLSDVEIVDAFITAGELALADHTLSETLARAETIERPYQKATALMEIAPRLARREQTARGAEILFEALTTLAMIDGWYYQSQALINLSGKYLELGLKAGEREQVVLEEMAAKL